MQWLLWLVYSMPVALVQLAEGCGFLRVRGYQRGRGCLRGRGWPGAPGTVPLAGFLVTASSRPCTSVNTSCSPYERICKDMPANGKKGFYYSSVQFVQMKFYRSFPFWEAKERKVESWIHRQRWFFNITASGLSEDCPMTFSYSIIWP